MYQNWREAKRNKTKLLSSRNVLDAEHVAKNMESMDVPPYPMPKKKEEEKGKTPSAREIQGGLAAVNDEIGLHYLTPLTDVSGSMERGDTKPDKAIADYTKAIQLNPGYAKAYYNRGVAHRDNGNHTKAVADFTEAIWLRPAFADAYYNRGVAHHNMDEPDKAIADYTDAIRLNPKDVEAYRNRGVLYGKKGEYDKAIADYTEAIRLNPGFPAAYYYRGIAHYEQGEYDKAIADYTAAIQINPEFALAYSNRGLAYYRKGEFDKAIDDYDEAIRLDPKLNMAHHNRGAVYKALGKYEEALADNDQAIRPHIRFKYQHTHEGVTAYEVFVVGSNNDSAWYPKVCTITCTPGQWSTKTPTVRIIRHLGLSMHKLEFIHLVRAARLLIARQKTFGEWPADIYFNKSVLEQAEEIPREEFLYGLLGASLEQAREQAEEVPKREFLGNSPIASLGIEKLSNDGQWVIDNMNAPNSHFVFVDQPCHSRSFSRVYKVFVAPHQPEFAFGETVLPSADYPWAGNIHIRYEATGVAVTWHARPSKEYKGKVQLLNGRQERLVVTAARNLAKHASRQNVSPHIYTQPTRLALRLPGQHLAKVEEQPTTEKVGQVT
jgi:tetratricopeptide (TPR) repeat protein